MAKLARNRGMFFGSWTGTAVSESASVEVAGDGITGAEVTAATFGTGVSQVTGVYVFEYVTGNKWQLNGTDITATEYGLTFTGSPAVGDKVTVTYTAASGGWEAIGKDTDDLSKDLNPDTETSKNVLGETTFSMAGYETEIDVETYHMDPSRIMYNHLLEIALEERTGGDDLQGWFAEAFFTSVNTTAQTMSGYCYVRKATYVPQSTGGDTNGFNIPYNIYPTGGMQKKNIVYDMATNIATITAIS